MKPHRRLGFVVCLIIAVGCSTPEKYDVIVRGGRVYDGSGAPPRAADVGFRGDAIAAIGDLRVHEMSYLMSPWSSRPRSASI